MGILSSLDKNADIGLVAPLGLQTRKNPITGVYSTNDLAFSAVAIINQLHIGLNLEPTLTSDHEPVIIEHKESTLRSQNPPTSPTLKLKNVNWDYFQEELTRISLEEELAAAMTTGKKTERFKDLLLEVAKKTIPIKTLGKKTRNEPVWWNEVCSLSKKKLNQASNKSNQILTIEKYRKTILAQAKFRKTIK